MILKYLWMVIFPSILMADNVGWKSYLTENPTEFHDIPLTWESGNQTKVPNWLSGIYVRNGPAQVKPKKSIGSTIKNYVHKVFQSENSALQWSIELWVLNENV